LSEHGDVIEMQTITFYINITKFVLFPQKNFLANSVPGCNMSLWLV